MATIFVAQFPGPISGQTIANDALLKALHDASLARTRKVNTSRGNSKNKLLNNFIKIFRMGFAIIFLASIGWRYEKVYHSLDANRGRMFALIVAGIARMYRQKLIIHHHTLSHISKHSKVMSCIARVMPDASHITICAEMSKDLKGRYPNIIKTIELSNIFMISKEEVELSPRKSGISLGHMGLLCAEKGTIRAVELFQRLKMEFDENAELHIAGRFKDESTRRYVLGCARKDGNIIYHGEVRGSPKDAFFRQIDIFLFPSEYANETQGIVNLEALSYSIPSFPIGRACVLSDFSQRPEWVVSDVSRYVQDVYSYIVGHATVLKEIKMSAGTLFDSLKLDADEALQRVIKEIA